MQDKFKGKKISYLVPISKHTIGGYVKWRCKCSCGATVYRRQDYLCRVLRENIKSSCGCQHPIKKKRGKENYNWRGCGDLSQSYFKYLKRRGGFTITIEEVWATFTKQKGRCILSGLHIEDINRARLTKDLKWIHPIVYKMQREMKEIDFLRMCSTITNHQLNISRHHFKSSKDFRHK